MKNIILLLCMTFIFISCKNENKEEEPVVASENMEEAETDSVEVNIEPISHATAVVNWGEESFYIDPTGGAAAFEGKPEPSFILITDIHGDHMDAETLTALELDSVQIVAPQAVKEKLPAELQQNVLVMNNGATQNLMGFEITAIPMYNLPEAADAFHPKGRGNGYVVEKGGKRLYIAGDTEDIPEMRDLQNIDMALVPMNLPYTMTVEQAAEGVLAFEPKRVYPYHFRGGEGMADVDKFKELVTSKNDSIEVVMLNWYPENETAKN